VISQHNSTHHNQEELDLDGGYGDNGLLLS